MRAVVQRASEGRVVVDGEVVGKIGKGLVVLLGVSPEDGDREVAWAAEKICNLRIFEDEDGKMNRSLLEVGGDVLLVSQFTLYGDARKGRRPSFVHAAAGPEAEAIYENVAEAIRAAGVRCETGVFGAMMQVTLTNDGPVTILLDSTRLF